MPERRSFVQQLVEGLKKMGPGGFGALAGFVLALLLVLFGVWKTLFILFFAAAGYYLGIRYFASRDDFRALLDKLFPPGFFR